MSEKLHTNPQERAAALLRPTAGEQVPRHERTPEEAAALLRNVGASAVSLEQGSPSPEELQESEVTSRLNELTEQLGSIRPDTLDMHELEKIENALLQMAKLTELVPNGVNEGDDGRQVTLSHTLEQVSDIIRQAKVSPDEGEALLEEQGANIYEAISNAISVLQQQSQQR